MELVQKAGNGLEMLIAQWKRRRGREKRETEKEERDSREEDSEDVSWKSFVRS